MGYPRRVAGAALVAVGLAVFAAACMGSAKGNGAPVAADYASCLREHGVNLPQFSPGARPSGVRPSGVRPSGVRPSGLRPSASGRPGGGFGFGTQAPPGVDQSTWDKALQACASLRPSGNPQRSRDNGAVTAYRNCLADHGVTAPGGPGQLDSTDPTVAAAMQACAALRPSARPSPAP